MAEIIEFSNYRKQLKPNWVFEFDIPSNIKNDLVNNYLADLLLNQYKLNASIKFDNSFRISYNKGEEKKILKNIKYAIASSPYGFYIDFDCKTLEFKKLRMPIIEIDIKKNIGLKRFAKEIMDGEFGAAQLARKSFSELFFKIMSITDRPLDLIKNISKNHKQISTIKGIKIYYTMPHKLDEFESFESNF